MVDVGSRRNPLILTQGPEKRSPNVGEFSFSLCVFLLAGALQREAQKPQCTGDTEERKEFGEVTWRSCL